MNIYKKITNERWQIALDRIKTTKKDQEYEESVVEIRENIKFILSDNQNGELKDQKQLSYLLKHFNQIQFFQELWKFKAEQFYNKIIDDQKRENGMYEQQKENRKEQISFKKRSKSPPKSPSSDLDDYKKKDKEENEKNKNEKSNRQQEIEQQVERELLDAQRKLFSNVKLCRYERNSFIYKEGDKNCQYFYIVWFGETEETLSSDALSNELAEKHKISRKRRIKEGEYFGEKELVIRGQRQASVRCLEETYVLYVNQQIFYSLLSGFIKFRNPILISKDDGTQKSIISTFLDREDILQLSYISQTQSLIYGNNIYQENEIADSFYALSQGQVTFSKLIISQIDHLENSRVTPPKRRKQVSFITALEYFGEENMKIQYESIHHKENGEDEDDEDDDETVRARIMLQIQSKRQFTATVASDRALIHRIPYFIFLEKMYHQYSHLKSHDLLNKYLETRTSWRNFSQQKMEDVISKGRYHRFIEGKSTNLLACKTGEPLEKYSLDRLREPILSSKSQFDESKRSTTVGIKSRVGGKILRKMSTVNSIVLTEDNNQENQTIPHQQNLISNQSFTKFQDLPINYNNAGLNSFIFQKSNSNSPEKRINQNQSFLNLLKFTEQESDMQQQLTPGKVFNLNHRNSRLGNQVSQYNYSSKQSKKNESRLMKEADINFLDFIQMKEQAEMKKTIGQQQQVTPKSFFVQQQQQFQFDQNNSFLQTSKYNPQSKLSQDQHQQQQQQQERNQNKFQDNSTKKYHTENSLRRLKTNNLIIQVNNGEEKILKQQIPNMIVQKTTPQNSKSQTNGVTTQHSRDISPDIRKKYQNQRRFTNSSQNSNHPLIKIIQDSQDRRQSQLQDLRSKSSTIRAQASNQSQTPRGYSQYKNNEANQQRLVTDLDDFYKQNTYIESLIEERQSNLCNDSSIIMRDDRMVTATPEFNEKMQNNSMIKRKQYSAMLQSQLGQQKIPISISNQKSVLFDLDDKDASSNILHFKQKAIKQVTQSNLPVKLDVSGICQQTHRYDHLIRKLEMKKKNLKVMQEQEYSDKRRIPSSKIQYKKSQNIILNMVDNYFKNISNNSGYPQGGPSLKQFVQNNLNTGTTTAIINGNSTQYSKSGSTKPNSELSKNSFINYFRSPLKTAQSFRSKSNPKQNQTTLSYNIGNGARHLSVTNPAFRDKHTDLNQTFSTFMLTNTQLSPI